MATTAWARPTAPRSLRVNFVWTLAGNTIGAASQWVPLLLLARIGDARMVGQYVLGLAIAAPIFLLAGLHLRTIQVTDVGEEFEFGDYLALRLACVGVAFLTVLVGIALSGCPRQTGLVIVAVALAKAIEAVSDVFHGRWQQRERMDWCAISMIARGAGSVALLGAALVLTGDPVWAALGTAAAGAVTLLVYDLRREQRTPRPRWIGANLRRILKLALPLGVMMMLMSLHGSVPRWFLAEFRSEREIGVFGALGYVAIAANTVVMALGQAASPRLARFHARGDLRGLLRFGGGLALAAVILGLAGVTGARFWGREILGLLYGQEYASQRALFELQMWVGALGLLACAVGYLLSSARCFLWQNPVFAAVCATTAAACWWLVPGQGMRGAAEAQLLGYSLQLVLTTGLLAVVLRRSAAQRTASEPALAGRA